MKTDSVDGLAVRASYQTFLRHAAGHLQGRQRRGEPLYVPGGQADPASAGDQDAVDVFLRSQMKAAVAASTAAAFHGLCHSQTGQFALLGADFLVDETGRAWLLEFTKGPALRMTEDYLHSLHRDMLLEMLELVMSFTMQGFATSSPRSQLWDEVDLGELMHK